MGMAAIFFNDAEPFEQIDNTPSTGPWWNLVKIGQLVSEKIIRRQIKPGAKFWL